MEDQEFFVDLSPAEIRCHRPDGRTESVLMAELDAVAIEPADAAPVPCEHLWVLAAGERACVVPAGAAGEAAQVAYLKSLPGFDYRAILTARRSTGYHRLLCWQRGDLAH